MRVILSGNWSFKVSVFYASWRGGRRREEEGDVAIMEDKIEVTVHVIGIFPPLNLSPIYSSECASTRLFLCSNIPMRQSQMINLKTGREVSKDEMDSPTWSSNIVRNRRMCASYFSRSLFTRIQQNLDHGYLHSDEPLGLTHYAALCNSLRPLL